MLLVLAACSSPPPAPVVETSAPPPAAPIGDLSFNDSTLHAAATTLKQQARLRGIETSRGRTRVERLLALEAEIGGSAAALNRVNELMSYMTATDMSLWAKLRQRADRDLAGRDDEAARRVRDLLGRWSRRKSEEVFRYLSSNYQTHIIWPIEWERRFHSFIAERPVDAATWGWVVLQYHGQDAWQQYGRADAESAYRFYLELSGLGDGREARRIFSVPNVAIETAP